MRVITDAHQALTQSDRAGERVEARVPCNGCTACCYSPRVKVDPARERPEDLLHLDLIPAPEPCVPGGMMLRKRPDGACVHLGPNGCAVHQHRPRACRIYDCRISAAAGLYETHGEAKHQAPEWVCEQATAEDRAMAAALMLCAKEYVDRHQGQPGLVQDATIYAYRMLRQHWPLLRLLCLPTAA